MKNKLYLKLFISLIILLIGYNYASEITNYWEDKVLRIASLILAGLFLIGFGSKSIAKRNDTTFDYKYLFPISFGIIGLFLVNYFIPALAYKLMNKSFDNDILKSIINLPRFLIMLILVVLLEELYFRRIVAQMILNEKGFSKAMWVSSIIFSLSHFYADTGLLGAFIGGIILSYIYLKTNSLILSFITHLTYNFTSLFVASKLNENIIFWISYKAIISMILIGVLLIFLMFYIFENTQKKTIGIKPAGNSYYNGFGQ